METVTVPSGSAVPEMGTSRVVAPPVSGKVWKSNGDSMTTGTPIVNVTVSVPTATPPIVCVTVPV